LVVVVVAGLFKTDDDAERFINFSSSSGLSGEF
jgi:hypothetical protein